MINIVVIGNGETPSNRVSTWVNMNKVNIVGFVNVNQTLKADDDLEKIQSKHIPNIRELNHVKVDMIDICTTLKMNKTILEQIVTQNPVLICDISKFGHIEGLLEWVKIQQEKNLKLYFTNPLNYSPPFIRAKNQVKENALGKPGVIRIAIQSTQENNDKSIFQNIGIDILSWILDTFGHVTRITAKQISKSTNHTSIHYGVAILKMENNAIVHLELTSSKYNKGYSFEIAGDQGMITYDSNESNPISVETGKRIEMDDMILSKSVLERQLEDVIASYKTNEKCMIPVENIIEAVHIAKFAEKSAEKNKPIEVERRHIL